MSHWIIYRLGFNSIYFLNESIFSAFYYKYSFVLVSNSKHLKPVDVTLYGSMHIIKGAKVRRKLNSTVGVIVLFSYFQGIAIRSSPRAAWVFAYSEGEAPRCRTDKLFTTILLSGLASTYLLRRECYELRHLQITTPK